MPQLFSPLTLRGATSRNRIWLPPMCQYAVTERDGVPTDWHLVQLGARAVGGFGLVMAEATAVTPQGRISPEDAGLWNDQQGEAWSRIVDFIHDQGALAGVQLAHAGRKAGSSTGAPWFDPGAAPAAAWETIGPSALAWNGFPAPRAMDTADIAAVVAAFATAARRAHAAGFDVIELHGAHGYLLHEFLSPLSNIRDDAYGGPFANRARFLTEVVTAVRAAVPDSTALVVRLSATDWIDGGWQLDDCVALAAALGDHGVDLIDASSGGLDERQTIPVAPGYQVGFAEQIRARAGIPTGAVGLITEPDEAEEVIASGKADIVSIGRAALREPAWPLRAAFELGLPRSEAPYRPAHLRGAWRAIGTLLER
ncbi:NADH:flavin oxidoreductase/NADH oxidase [Mycolicibacterium sp.]|uniref:NADH:flavin oxidoreductase/NADH oxidase n=1 Tax=Mycolicibacterium sp. TaxID=2320850 RepID=UPI003D127461